MNGPLILEINAHVRARPVRAQDGHDPAWAKHHERLCRDAQPGGHEFEGLQRGAGFAALDRAPSYVELLTCLEMAKQAKELPVESTMGAVTNRR